MTWDIIAATGAWAGALAVIATLYYLARQIQLNTEQLKLQRGDSLRNRAVVSYDPIYEGRNAEIFYKGLYAPEELNEIDGMVFSLLMSRHMGAIAVVADHYRGGLITEAEKNAYIEDYRTMLFASKGGKAWLNRHDKHMRGVFKLLGMHSADPADRQA